MIKKFLTYESSVHNIAVSSGNVVLSESDKKCTQIKHILQTKTVIYIYVGGFWCESATWDGFLHWRKHYYGQKQVF